MTPLTITLEDGALVVRDGDAVRLAARVVDGLLVVTTMSRLGSQASLDLTPEAAHKLATAIGTMAAAERLKQRVAPGPANEVAP